MTVTIDIKDAELRRLTEHIIGPQALEPFGAYMFQTDEPGAELGRFVERAVFLESFGNTPEQLAEEYAPYEDHSVFICVIDQIRKLPVGVMRVLLPYSEDSFKSLADIESVWGMAPRQLMDQTGVSIDLSKTWDIATLAVLPDYRAKATGGLVAMGLYQTLTLTSRQCGVEWYVAILDMPVFRMLRWKLQQIFVGYKGISPMPYLGSPASMPAWCDVIDAEIKLRKDPSLHEVLVQGIGLEAAMRRVDMDCTQWLVA